MSSAAPIFYFLPCTRLVLPLLLPLLLGMWLLIPRAQAQQMPYQHITGAQGLPNDNVFAVAQDALGYIWMATEGGLTRYDGEEFGTYTKKDGLLADLCVSVVATPDSLLWVTHKGKGLSVLRIHPEPKVLVNTQVEELTHLMTRGTSVFGLSTLMLYEFKYDPMARTISRRYIHSSPGRGFLGSVKHAPASIMAGGYEGLMRFTYDSLICIVENRQVRALTPAPGGGHWVGGNSFLERYDSLGNFMESASQLNGRVPSFMYQDSRQRIWVSFAGGGLALLHGNRLEELEGVLPLLGNTVTYMFEDREGNMWMSTYGKGVLCLVASAARNFTRKEGMPNNYVQALVYDSTKQQLWVGTATGLGVLRNDSVWYLEGENAVLSKAYVRSLKLAHGKLWVGSVFATRRNSFQGNRVNLGGEEVVYAAAAAVHPFSADSALFMSTMSYWGLAQGWNGKGVLGQNMWSSKLSGFNSAKGRVNDMLQVDDGRLFGASKSGVFVTANACRDGFVALPGLEGIVSNALLETRPGELWVGTLNGLYRLRGQALEQVHFSSIPGSLSVTDLLQDREGRLWVATFAGLYCLEGDGKVQFYGLNDGLPGQAVHALAYDPTAHLLYVGTGNGLCELNLRQLAQRSAVVPSLRLARIELEGRSLVNPPRLLTVQPGGNVITFHYTGQVYSTPEKVSYQYRFGEQGTWQTLNGSELTLVGLAPGEHRVQARARLGEGEWSAMQEHVLEVPRDWVGFLLRIGIALLGLALALLGTVRLRDAYVRRQEAQKRSLDRRMAQLRHQAISASLNPHFIFNALNSIQSYINQADRVRANDYLSRFAALIRMNMDQAANDLQPLAAEMERLEIYLSLEKLRFTDKLQYHVSMGPTVDAAHLAVPSMVLQPFVENSIIHGLQPKATGGHVWVKIDVIADNRLCLRVEDDGIGLEASRAKKRAGHISRGTSLVREHVQLMQQLTGMQTSVTIEDHPSGPGTLVTVILPMVQC